MSGEALAGSCFNAFRQAVVGQGGTYPEWDALDESLHDGFLAAAKYLEDFFEGEPQEGTTWRMTAANCYWQFCRAAGETPLEQDKLPADVMRSWEAFTRHCCNMLVLDSSDPNDAGVEGHEAYWHDWAAEKKAAEAMPQQQAEALDTIKGD